jgi:hypothetical protein
MVSLSSDVHMPTISGYNLARRLGAKLTPAVMQLVMMSGTDLDETTLAGAKRAGFDHCIDWVRCCTASRRIVSGILLNLAESALW